MYECIITLALGFAQLVLVRYQNICNNSGFNQKYAIVQFSIIVRLSPQSLAHAIHLSVQN